METTRKYPSDAATESHEAMATPLPSPTIPLPEPSGEKSDGVRAIQDQIEILRRARAQERQQEAAEPTAEDRRRQWLESSSLARQHVAVLNDLHREALDAGHADTSPAYFDFMNDRLATLSAQNPAPGAHLVEDMQHHIGTEDKQEPEEAANVRSSFVSAPVSREPASYSGRPRSGGLTRLTAAEREHARVAGISEAEYARQKLRYEQMRESGEYGDRR